MFKRNFHVYSGMDGVNIVCKSAYRDCLLAQKSASELKAPPRTIKSTAHLKPNSVSTPQIIGPSSYRLQQAEAAAKRSPIGIARPGNDSKTAVVAVKKIPKALPISKKAAAEAERCMRRSNERLMMLDEHTLTLKDPKKRRHY